MNHADFWVSSVARRGEVEEQRGSDAAKVMRLFNAGTEGSVYGGGCGGPGGNRLDEWPGGFWWLATTRAIRWAGTSVYRDLSHS
jgi:hypothetical protein